jgi:hypothetical protein
MKPQVGVLVKHVSVLRCILGHIIFRCCIPEKILNLKNRWDIRTAAVYISVLRVDMPLSLLHGMVYLLDETFHLMEN